MAYLDAILIFSLASITVLLVFVFTCVELEYRNCRREKREAHHLEVPRHRAA